MKFKINNDTWEIRKANKDKMKELWNKITGEETCVFGLIIKTSQIIYICSDICEEQQIKTLKHELAHCYIWEYGLYYSNFEEEIVCEIVAKSNDFINEIINKYTKNIEDKL